MAGLDGWDSAIRGSAAMNRLEPVLHENESCGCCGLVRLSALLKHQKSLVISRDIVRARAVLE